MNERVTTIARFLVAIFGISTLILVLAPMHNVYAAQITARKLTLSSSSSAAANATTSYTFSFTVPTTATAIKSVSVDMCTTASGGACITPTGFLNSSSTLASQPTNLGSASGWTVNTATPGSLRILNAANATNPTGSQTIVFGNVQNPTTTNQTFYGRITTYSTSTWTTAVDTGTVAASTATQIVLTGTMPESLIFCAGITVSTTAGVPDCSTAGSGAVTFNQLFSPTDTATATSQMAASTNAGTGYVITVNGATLTSGGNTIAPMSGGLGIRGTSQFGMNLMANTTLTSTPAIGTAVTPTANGTNYRGQPFTGYLTADSFKFLVAGDTVANSANGSAGPSDAQIFTASYIVNVSGSQAAGSYTTTLTFICTALY